MLLYKLETTRLCLTKKCIISYIAKFLEKRSYYFTKDLNFIKTRASLLGEYIDIYKTNKPQNNN